MFQEETLYIDFNAILAAVGGSLGLFLGFSCLDCCTYLTKQLLDFADKAQPKLQKLKVEVTWSKKDEQSTPHRGQGITDYVINRNLLRPDYDYYTYESSGSTVNDHVGKTDEKMYKDYKNWVTEQSRAVSRTSITNPTDSFRVISRKNDVVLNVQDL